jgi:hypothetical protein
MVESRQILTSLVTKCSTTPNALVCSSKNERLTFTVKTTNNYRHGFVASPMSLKNNR